MNPVQNQINTSCTDPSSNHLCEAQTVNQYITSETTPEQFDIFCKDLKDYQLSDGGRCGWTALAKAAYTGNSALINHIVIKGGISLLNLRTLDKQTPLHKAVCCKDTANSCLAIKALNH